MAKERPILFSAPMVRALLNGTKTQTRRVVKPQPEIAQLLTHSGWSAWHDGSGRPLRNPYGQPGDRLWVREAWQVHHAGGDEPIHGPMKEHPGGLVCMGYRATEEERVRDHQPFAKPYAGPWRPSIHMPRWACRLVLEVTDVRVQRLQAISGADAVAEGVYARLPDNGIAQSEFADLWRSINGADSWTANPWVWAVSFRRVTP